MHVVMVELFLFIERIKRNKFKSRIKKILDHIKVVKYLYKNGARLEDSYEHFIKSTYRDSHWKVLDYLHKNNQRYDKINVIDIYEKSIYKRNFSKGNW